MIQDVHNVWKRRLGFLIGVLLFSLLGIWSVVQAVGSAGSSPTVYMPIVHSEPAAVPPQIMRFQAASPSIEEGESVTLTWQVANEVTELLITPTVVIPADSTSVVVSPITTTTYTLTAVNAYGSDTASLQVMVMPATAPPVTTPPDIISFTVVNETINEGETAVLQWQVSGFVETMTIEPGIGDVTLLESVEVSPTETTVYTLTAINSAGSSQQQVQLTVINPPVIASFTSDEASIEEGSSTTLRWTVDNPVDSLTIEPGVGDVTGQTSVEVAPTSDTEYTITAVNGAGFDTATVNVTVTEPEFRIVSFTADKTNINSGQDVVLSWVVTGNYDTLRINNGVGNVMGQTSVTVSPTSDTTYRLTAKMGDETLTATVSIDVNTSGGGGGPSTGGPNMVAYDWNGPVTESDRGFPREQPPRNNGDWTDPYNYAGGTLYYRAEIRNQPVAQMDMKLQWCVWQRLGSNNFGLENCGRLINVAGTSGNVVCWSQGVNQMWKKGGKPIEWDRARYRTGVAVKNGDGNPVSDYEGWNWYGEDPDDWYPLNMRFTVIVVPKGGTFDGWGAYGGGC